MEAILPEVLSTTIAINGDILMGLEVVVFAMTVMGGALLGDFGGFRMGASIQRRGRGPVGSALSGGGVSYDGLSRDGVRTRSARVVKCTLLEDEFVGKDFAAVEKSKERVRHPGGPFLFTFKKPSLANQQIL